MSDLVFENLDFNYYANLFVDLAGLGYEIGFINKHSEIVDGISEYNIDRFNTYVKSNGSFFDTLSYKSPFHLVESINHTSFLCFLIGKDDNIGIIGLLVVFSKSDDEKLSVNLSKSLATVSDDLAREYRLNMELNSMTVEMSDRYEELNLIYDMGRTIKKHGHEEAVYQEMTKLCANSLNVDLAVFILKDKKNPVYEINSEEKIDNLDLILVRLRSEILNFVKSSLEPLVITDKNDPRREYIFSELPYKILAHPVQLGRIVKGVLVILKHEHGSDFTNSDRNLIGVIAEQCAILLRNHEMHHEAAVFTNQMAAALIESVDAKDPYTRGHSDRVSQYSLEIGHQMNLSTEDLWALKWSSLLHDVGKIGVPDKVLSKPGRLTSDEYNLIKGHPARGVDILSHVQRLQNALPGMKYHHERIDGTGYPEGLPGNRIPLQALIVSVADTYDAMTSSRAYRPARSHEEAMTEIRRVTGSQLDAKVVSYWAEVVKKKAEKLMKSGAERKDA